MVLTLVKNRNRTEMALDATTALDAGTLQCQPAEKNMHREFRAPRVCRSIRTKVYSIVLSSYFNMQKRPKISACAENHPSQEALKRKSTFEGLPWSRAPARLLSVLRHRTLRETDVFLPAFHAVIHVVLVHELVCVYLRWRASLIQRERKNLFVGSCEPEKSVSFVKPRSVSSSAGEIFDLLSQLAESLLRQVLKTGSTIGGGGW